jgi:hypothetical protein
MRIDGASLQEMDLMRVIRICKFCHNSLAARRQSPRRRSVGAAGGLAAAALALALMAAAPAEIVVVSAGLFGPATPLGEVGQGLREETLSGVDQVALPPLLRQTDEVPAELCRSFGLIYAETGASAGALTIRITHPPLRRPDGATGSVDLFDAPATPGLHFVGFTFDERWELAPGRWTFTILAGDQVLASHGFTVLPASGGALGCGSSVS